MATVIIGIIVAVILFLAARQLYVDKKVNLSAEENAHLVPTAALVTER